jgi:hypothetical protein
MLQEQLTTDSPDLLLHLRFVMHRVRHCLLLANLYEVARDTGLSYSGLARIRAGGVMSLPTLETLAYYFSPKPEPKQLDVSKLTRLPVDSLNTPLPPPSFDPAPWNL